MARHKIQTSNIRTSERSRSASIAGTAFAAFIAAMLLSMPAMADEAKAPAITPRQMAHCMMQRLHEDRTQTYKVAFKLCREDLTAAQNPRLANTAMNAPGAVEPTKQP